jgi:N-acylneuraminate cytidylyltransferase
MIDGNTVVAVIPARGGSKGLPGKNLRAVGGRPLIAWSMEAAQGSRHIDRLVLSSDDEEIIAVARKLGLEAPFIRPGELATDCSPIEDALIHALGELAVSYDYLVLLQPTSPLRRAGDIDGAIEACHASGAPACISVCETPKSPYWMVRLDDEGRMHRLLDWDGPRHRRQNLPLVFAPNGAVYVAQVPWLIEHRTFSGPDTRAYVMPPERSLDIDTELDLLLVEALLK